MIIAFDLHGVLETNTDTFKKVIKFLREKVNVDIYVISGPPIDQIYKELVALGYDISEYTFKEVISVVDYLKKSGVKMWQDERGNWWCSEEDWWTSKSKICKDYNVDYLFDDKLEYQLHFGKDHLTKFILMNEEVASNIEFLITCIVY